MYSQSPRNRSKNTPITENLDVSVKIHQATTPLEYPTGYTVTSSSLTSTIDSSVSETMSDFVVENFWKGRALGYVFNNPMEHRIYEQSQSACDFDLLTTVYQCAYQTTDWTKHYNVSRVTSKEGSISFASCALGAPTTSYLALPNSPNVSSMRDRAVSTAFSSIGHDEILALASMKEAKTTVAGLIQTARKVVKVFRAVKHFNVQKARGLLFQNPTLRRKNFKSIASQAEDVYMNARYNLRPLYYDMLGLLKLTADQAYPRLTFRGEESETATNTDSTVYNHTGTLYSGTGNRPVMRLDRVANRTVKVRAGVLTRILDLSLSSRLGLDATALAATAWDLVPFSFIADWFFDVGNTLLAWAPKPGIETLTSWVTVEAIDECINTIKLVSFDPGTGPPLPWVYAATGFNQTLTMTSPKKVWRYVDKYRLPNPSRPILPSIKINLDLLKLTDLFIIAKKMVSYSRI